MYSILQVVAAFYASLQIRCTAHNLRIAGFTKYKITYQKARLFINQRKPNYDKAKAIRGIFSFFVCYLKFCNSKLSDRML